MHQRHQRGGNATRYSLPVICFCFWDLLRSRLVYREHLSDHAYALAGHALAEEYTHAGTHVLGMPDKLEHDRGGVIGAQLLAAHDAAYDRCLANAANVHSGLKTHVNGSGVEQHGDFGLQGEKH